MNIAGMNALVVGGASGLGEGTVRHLANHGAKVAIIDRDADAAASVASAVNGHAQAADVTDSEALVTAYDRHCSALGEAPRIVINCAGIGTAARILPRDGSLSLELFERTIQVNLMGSYSVLSLAARGMTTLAPLGADGERGVIVNTASVAYQDGQIGQAAYAASKGGIASMTLPAARELARFGIRVMTIAPGLFSTAMSAGLTDDVRAALEATLPFPSRMGKPEEYALLVQQIIENPLLNGEVIRLDSAVRLAPK